MDEVMKTMEEMKFDDIKKAYKAAASMYEDMEELWPRIHRGDVKGLRCREDIFGFRTSARAIGGDGDGWMGVLWVGCFFFSFRGSFSLSVIFPLLNSPVLLEPRLQQANSYLASRQTTQA